jgi:hypothetical protein
MMREIPNQAAGDPQGSPDPDKNTSWSATSSAVDYVCRLQEGEIDELFASSELAVFGILRALPALAKIILLRLIAFSTYIEKVPAQMIGSWIADPRTEERNDPVWGLASEGIKAVEHASLNIEAERNRMVSQVLDTLTRLRFLRRTEQMTDSAVEGQHRIVYSLMPLIRERFGAYLWRQQEPESQDARNTLTDAHENARNVHSSMYWTKMIEPFERLHGPEAPVTKFDLNTVRLYEYTRQSWERILHFVIGMPLTDTALETETLAEESTKRSTDPPSDEVIEALLSLGVSEQVGQEGMRITERGFSYLLLDLHSQIWALLEVVMESWDEARQRRLELLDLLFRLGFATPGQVYAVSDPRLSADQRHMLGFLAEIGIVLLGSRTEQALDRCDTLGSGRKRSSQRVPGALSNKVPPDHSVTAVASRPESAMSSHSRMRRTLLHDINRSESLSRDARAVYWSFSARCVAQLERNPDTLFFTPTPLGSQIMMGSADETLARSNYRGPGLRHTEILIESGPMGSSPSAVKASLLRSGIGRSSPFQVIVETNFRLYAYAASMFQVALLSLFTRILYRMPGLTIGVITRDSVRRALKCGITAKQLLHFLTIHAMDGKSIPFNVHDQILLWELERQRIQAQPGVLLESFEPTLDGRAFFEQLQSYTLQTGAQRWCDPVRQLLVLDASAFDRIREWIRGHAGTLS